MNRDSLTKFQDLLRTLFQFDCADLDFGIYRILNYKRSHVEAFITERLPQIVGEAFAQYAAADKAQLEQELEQKREEIRQTLGKDAIDERGQLRLVFYETPLGKDYLALREKQAQYQTTEEFKTRVYNDLYTFFSRYYEDGDFISKRRYGRHEAYAIPYSGEEVVLYWANRDQYYVKTGDRFKAYRFKVGDYTVAFELRNAAPEPNGNTGKKRYFVLAHEAPITWNEEAKTLTIAFEHRPLTEAEEKEHGRTEQQKPQDSLNKAAEEKILERVADDNLKKALARQGADGASLLRKHLTRFTRKNTTDFFIHKALRGFLRRELDFFIKNEVLRLDELIGGSEENLRQLVLLARVERQVAEGIIDFLAQVEDFQKKLWEKKKFVLRAEYCLTIDRVPEELWDEVLANEAQVAEWRQLYSVEGRVNKDFLKAHPTLVIDTRHFPEDFKWRLLAHFDDLDEALDGLLIKSENWQALNLLLEKYREKVKCIYIDPPYNTGSDEFIYKDRYQHSSWLSMMADRLALGRTVMTDDGVIFVNIDDHEVDSLRFCMDTILRKDNYLATMIWRKRAGGGSDSRFVSTEHDYILIYSRDSANAVLNRLPSKVENYPHQDARGRYTKKPLHNPGLQDSAGLHYDILCPDGTFLKGEEHQWVYAESTFKKMKSEDRVIFEKRDKGWVVYYKLYMSESKGFIPYSILYKVAFNSDGNADLRALGLSGTYSHPKPTKLLEHIAIIATSTNGLVLDHFAGSGTTAHAVINLNRQDSGKRKYILVEIGDWFETVILPRIKKVVFCEKWKDGKPQGGPGVSHMLKYHYLEQYEDTLNNLELPREKDGQLALEKFGDEYLLKYMLEFETQGCPSLLNLDRFKDPFAYRLKVQEGDEIVERPVDLVETFNYLLGIEVRKVRAFEDNGRLYRAILGEKNGKRVAIIWRSVVGLEDNEEALMQDKTFIEETVLPALLGEAKPDRLLVNGACFVKDAEVIEPEFHRLMFAPVGV